MLHGRRERNTLIEYRNSVGRITCNVQAYIYIYILEDNFKKKLKNIVGIYVLRSYGSVYSPLARFYTYTLTHTHTHTHTHTYIYIYIERERERDRQTERESE